MSIKIRFNAVLVRFFVACGLLISVSVSSFSEPMNLSLLRKEIETYYDSGRYEREIKEILSEARKYVIEQALVNKKDIQPKRLALILDIDETSLSNYRKMIKRNFISIPQQIHQEILDANSPPLPGALELYQAALDHDVHVFFITGRKESEREATQQNLITAGFKKWVALYVRPDIYEYHSIIPFKTRIRKLIVDQGYTIIASVGDQHSDLEGGFVRKGFKLPNPFYFLP